MKSTAAPSAGGCACLRCGDGGMNTKALDELLKLDLATEPVPMEEPEYHDLARAAAEELAAMRKQLAEAREYGDEWQRSCQDQMATVERLGRERDGLRGIVNEIRSALSESGLVHTLRALDDTLAALENHK